MTSMPNEFFGVEWALRATKEERRAVLAVDLLIQSTSILMHHLHRDLTVRNAQLHEHFPAFARDLGLKGKLYQCVDGICPAVELSERAHRDIREGRKYSSTILPARDRQKMLASAFELVERILPPLMPSDGRLLEHAEKFVNSVQGNIPAATR